MSTVAIINIDAYTETMENDTFEPTVWKVPLANVVELSNPMEDDVWGCGEITIFDVLSCENAIIGCYTSGQTSEDSESKEYNVARIAWLTEHYDWENMKDDEPIQIELMEDGSWHPIVDGNHRVAAATVLGIEHIIVEVSGDIDYCEEILQPIKC